VFASRQKYPRQGSNFSEIQAGKVQSAECSGPQNGPLAAISVGQTADVAALAAAIAALPDDARAALIAMMRGVSQ
jgi:hypothetical protein